MRQPSSRRAFMIGTGATALLAAAPGPVSGATDAADPIIIGMQADLTGALAHDGLWEQRALAAAVDWHNKRGGIAGRPLKLVVADTETKTDVGIRRLRQLIEKERCDFVVGSGSGGIGVASVPIARDAGVVYLPLSRTDSITTETANPWLYRFVSNSSMAARGARRWMMETVGKRWSILISDIAFGHSQRDAFASVIKEAGGEVAQVIALPLGTPDPLPFLLSIDRSVDGILTAFWGPDSVKIYPALVTAGVQRKPKFAVSSSTNLFDVLKLGRAVDGLYVFDEVPWELQDYPEPERARLAFSAIGIGPNGRAAVGDDYVMLPSAVVCWEYVSFYQSKVMHVGV